LGTWRKGLELPGLCHFVVVPRAGHTAGDFVNATRGLWASAVERPPLLEGSACMALPGGGLAHFLSLPWLAISASRVRRLWLAGRNVDFLVPAAALRVLCENGQAVRDCWQKADSSC
jgi:nicotinate-nucleotide adenylyltransferase